MGLGTKFFTQYSTAYCVRSFYLYVSLRYSAKLTKDHGKNGVKDVSNKSEKPLDYFSRKKRLKENNFGETPKLFEGFYGP
jgi:hypothetical protein